MGVEHIDGADDPRVAGYRGVRDGELLRSRGLFVAEGRHIVRRVVEDARYRVQSVLVNDAALRDLEPVIAGVRRGRADPCRRREGVGRHRRLRRAPRMSGAGAPAAGRWRWTSCCAPMRTLVVLEGGREPRQRRRRLPQCGGVRRRRRAAQPDLLRSALPQGDQNVDGRDAAVPFARAGRGRMAGRARTRPAAGFTIVALTPREPSETLDCLCRHGPARRRIALIVGTEGAGLTPEVEAAADYRVRIPISDDVDSLNVAVAAGIALHALRTRTGRELSTRPLDRSPSCT